MSGARRLMLSGIALTALLAVVAVASRAHRPGGGTGSGPQHPPTLVFDYIASTMLVLLPLGAVLCIWALFVRRGEELRSGRSNWRRTAVMFGVAMAFLAIALLVGGHGLLRRDSNKDSSGAIPNIQPRGARTDASQPFYRAHFRWLPVLVLGSIVLGVGFSVGWVYVRRWRAGDGWEREAALAAALDEVLADTLDDLRAEQDPRQAVIRTYARMESTFAAYGVPREEAETPQEYVERVLDQLQVSLYSVRRVTQLFARAKFSVHEIDGGMKDDAIEALVGLRTELEYTPEGAPSATTGRQAVGQEAAP
jgi:Domain of unknown function (DUF4129)